LPEKDRSRDFSIFRVFTQPRPEAHTAVMRFMAVHQSAWESLWVENTVKL